LKLSKNEDWQAPIFIFADDDRGAVERFLERIHPEWYYIPVTNPRLVLRYAKRVRTSAIFLASPIDYPRGGAAALLQRLIDDVGKPVIILLEEWSQEQCVVWKKMGAADCLPHPTRFVRRLEVVRSKMQDLALSASPRFVPPYERSTGNL